MIHRLKEHAGMAALMVAALSLFVALTGIAGALPGKKAIDKNDLNKNVVKSKNVAPDALTGADVNEKTLNIPATAVDKTSFGASVDQNGNVTTATLSGTTAQKVGGNVYQVTFPRSVQGCVPTANGTAGLFGVMGSSLSAGKPNTVDVATLGSGGTPTALSFNLSVTC